MKLRFSVRAYTKMLLHASKYPHKAVSGVLLGDESVHEGEIYAIEAVPLFHICLGLAPMLEIALAQIDSYSKANKMHIVGYYQGNEHLNDSSPDATAYKIGERIIDHYNNGFLVMIDNAKMSLGCDEIACKAYTAQDNKWKLTSDKEIFLDGGEETLNLTSELMEAKAYQSLIDFDNHLDDITQDWLNRDINRLIDLSLSS